MKVFKKITTLVISLVMMLAMVTSAFATDSTGTITLHTGKHNVGGVTFNAYRIMDATGSDNKVAYTINTDFTEFYNSLSIVSDGSALTDNKVYEYLNKNVKDPRFISALKQYIENNSISSTKLELVTDTNTFTAESLQYGYYVIIPSSGNFSPNFTTLSSAGQDIYLKGLEPDVNKTVDNEDWTSAQIGDTVHFIVESMVPNMTGYTEYYFKLTDTFTDGLTVNADSLNLSVKIGGSSLTEGTHYTCTFDSTNSTITIEMKDFITYAQKANEIITFEYEAILNENALTNSPTTNKANISYGNDPDNLTNGTPDTVNVWTHDLTIKKVDATDSTTKLSGAEFQLYRGNSVADNSTPIGFVDLTNGNYRVATADDSKTTDTVVSPTNGVITIKGLDADTYQLVERKAPDGYNKLSAPISITITATSADSGTNVTVTGNNKTVENSSGTLLPETGGMGTIIFTLVGGIGVAGVIASFFISSKKKRKNNE